MSRNNPSPATDDGRPTTLVPADSDDSARFERVSGEPRTASGRVAAVGHGADTATVSGRVFLAIPDAVAKKSGSFEGFTWRLLRAVGLADVQAEDWYPRETLCTLLDHLEDAVGPQIVERVGRFLPEMLSWPEPVTDLAGALQTLEDWFRTWTRGDGDTVQVTITDDSQGELSLAMPYPVQFTTGLVRGLVHQFGSNATWARTSTEADDESVYRFTFGDSAASPAAHVSRER